MISSSLEIVPHFPSFISLLISFFYFFLSSILSFMSFSLVSLHFSCLSCPLLHLMPHFLSSLSSRSLFPRLTCSPTRVHRRQRLEKEDEIVVWREGLTRDNSCLPLRERKKWKSERPMQLSKCIQWWNLYDNESGDENEKEVRTGNEEYFFFFSMTLTTRDPWHHIFSGHCLSFYRTSWVKKKKKHLFLKSSCLVSLNLVRDKRPNSLRDSCHFLRWHRKEEEGSHLHPKEGKASCKTWRGKSYESFNFQSFLRLIFVTSPSVSSWAPSSLVVVLVLSVVVNVFTLLRRRSCLFRCFFYPSILFS